ncbi:MAG TPA: phage baseplate assembly protein V [Blastocatellia bacterium]|jgi:hypothetical protein
MNLQGKFRGKVENNVDPNHLGRIQISVPAVFGLSVSSWAMPCVPYAGNGVGFFAIPPKGASVWIEFENGDPESPIWSGCFWDAGDSVPASPDSPERKVFKTDKCMLTLDDSQGDGGGVTIEMGNAKIAIDPNKIEIKRGSWSVRITQNSVSINDGALEVT